MNKSPKPYAVDTAIKFGLSKLAMSQWMFVKSENHEQKQIIMYAWPAVVQ
jgi:hypothetical protein